MASKGLAAWERKQRANRRAYIRERRERIGTRWYWYGLAFGYTLLAIKLTIGVAAVYGFLQAF